MFLRARSLRGAAFQHRRMTETVANASPRRSLRKLMSPQATISRRLAAVLIADVVGYARLMERNETGTHTRLRAVRAEVTDPAIQANDGRIVRTVGDGLLVEFHSATDALIAAVAIQRDMRARNQGVPADERIEYRIGINLGDIIISSDDIAGDGVNLAARLQALADPGGICVSQTVQEQLHEDLGVAFVDAGEQRVKKHRPPGARVPGRAAAADQLGEGACALAHWRRNASLRGMVAGLLVLLIGAAVAGFWWQTRSFDPPRLSVAAMPFETIPADVQNTQLAIALSAELRNGLSRLGSGGAFSMPKAEVTERDPRGVARELNVRYVLTGALKRDADKLDVQAQLIDGTTGTAVWSDQFVYAQDGSNSADRLAAARLTAALRLELLRLEAQRAQQKAPAERDATDLAAMAYAVIYGPGYSDPARMKEAGEHLQKALQLEPNNVLAMTARADWLMYEIEYLPAPAAAPLRAEALMLAKRAVAVAPNDGEAWSSYASALELTHEYLPALEAVDRSLKLDPANVNSMLYRGRLLMLQGRFDEAVAQARAAVTLAPQVQDVVGSGALVECQAQYFFKRAHAEAVVACERATGLGVGGYVTSLLLAALYVHTGEPAKAQQAKGRALEEFPELRLNTFFEGRFDGPIGPQSATAQLKQLGFAE